jgi:hypothetical protein
MLAAPQLLTELRVLRRGEGGLGLEPKVLPFWDGAKSI